MTTDAMRLAISSVYSSDSWKRKVENMADGQVLAIYMKFLADGKFCYTHSRRTSTPPKPITKKETVQVGNKGCKDEYEQLTMAGF